MGWVPIPGGDDADAIHGNEPGEIAAITEKVSPVSADLLLIEDSEASHAKKKLQIGSLPSGGGGGSGVSYGETIGDGVATSIQVTHDFGTQDLVVQLWDLTGADPVEATADATSIAIDDDDNITITFSVAPATDSYRVVVLMGGGTGSGGGVSDVISIVDAPPVTPDPMDDEFDDESFDTGLWSDLNIGSVAKSEVSHGLTLTVDENANVFRGIYQVAPGGAFEFRSKIYAPPVAVANFQAALFVAKSTTERVYYVGWYNDGAPGLRGLQHSAPTDVVASWGNDWNFQANFAYIRVVWTGSALTFQWSTNGVSWSPSMGSTLAGGWTPGIVGLGISNRLGFEMGATFDWFRRIA